MLSVFLKKLEAFHGSIWLLKNKFKTKAVKLFHDKPGASREKISTSAEEMLRNIGDLKSELVLQTPYLIFSEKTLAVFKKLSLKESPPIFRFVTNSYASNDNIIAHILGMKDRYILRKLINIKIFEFLKYPVSRSPNEPHGTPISDHGKTLIIDSTCTYIGSSNFDPRSHNLNSEIGVIVDDESFAKLVRKDINSALIDGNFLIESNVVNGKNQITLFGRLKNIYSTLCFEPNLPSVSRTLLYPFQFLVPKILKRYF